MRWLNARFSASTFQPCDDLRGGANFPRKRSRNLTQYISEPKQRKLKMNKTNLKEHLLTNLSALIVIAALFPLAKAKADPPASVHGYTNDCETLISEQHHGSNTTILLSISATFTGTFDGTWEGTERDVIHGDGSVMLQGSGVFVGSVLGRSGTMIFS